MIVTRLHAACYVQALPNREPINQTENALQAVGYFALRAVWLPSPQKLIGRTCLQLNMPPLISILMLFYFQMEFHGQGMRKCLKQGLRKGYATKLDTHLCMKPPKLTFRIAKYSIFDIIMAL